MMRWVRLARLLLVVALAVLLVAAAMANRGPVTVHALPPDIAVFANADLSAEVPLFLVIFLSVAVGVAVGYVLEWLREGKHRRAASTGERRVTALAREVSRLRDEKGHHKDDVLALLDGTGKR